ncbi:MAG: hypothetical protein DRG11_00610 [Epsilonproteobacteria bacterium]|nr:MAG: hypothetical protein DRG11_00610 [Campylobacterota bacterium]
MKKTQGEIFAIALKELFTPPMLKLAFLPFVVTVVLFYIVFFYFMSDVSLSSGTGVDIVDHILQISAIAWILTFLTYILGIFALFWLGLFVAVLIAGLFTPYIIKHLKHKRYVDINTNGYGTILNTLLFILKTTFLMIFWFFILAPLYLIPVVNVVAINLPFFYFFHKMLHFDVASNMVSKEQQVVLKYRYNTNFRMYSLLLYLLSMIPFAVLILPVFYILYIAINYFELIKNDNDKEPQLLK